MRPNPDTWNCPLCSYRCAFGMMGCDAPETCERGEKNIHWTLRAEAVNVRGMGISEISNEEQAPDEKVR